MPNKCNRKRWLSWTIFTSNPFSTSRGTEYTHWLCPGYCLSWGSFFKDNQDTDNRRRSNRYWTSKNKCSLQENYKNTLEINRKWFIALNAAELKNQGKLHNGRDNVAFRKLLNDCDQIPSKSQVFVNIVFFRFLKKSKN